MNCVLKSVKKKERNALTLFYMFSQQDSQVFHISRFLLHKTYQRFGGGGLNSACEIYLQNTLMEK